MLYPNAAKMRHAIESLISFGAKLRPAADTMAIERAVSEYAITLPTDVRALYEMNNGSIEEFGNWSWFYWGIDSPDLTLASYFKQPREYIVSPDGRLIDPRSYVRFFDCLIDLPLYAYCADNKSPYFGEVIGCHTDNGKFDAFVSAKTVTRFLEILIASRIDEVILIDNGI